MNLRKRKKVNYKQDEYNFLVHNDPTFDVGPYYKVFYHPDVKNNYLEEAIEPDHDFFGTISAPYYDDDKNNYPAVVRATTLHNSFKTPFPLHILTITPLPTLKSTPHNKINPKLKQLSTHANNKINRKLKNKMHFIYF